MSIAKDAPSLLAVGGLSLVLAGVGTWLVLRRRSARRSGLRDGSVPKTGQAAQVLTHFGPHGGYIELGSLVLWATTDGAPDELTPGERCTVTALRPSGQVPVATVRSAGGPGSDAVAARMGEQP